jgi:hypothetical protein
MTVYQARRYVTSKEMRGWYDELERTVEEEVVVKLQRTTLWAFTFIH